MERKKSKDRKRRLAVQEERDIPVRRSVIVIVVCPMTSVSKEGGNCGTKSSFAPHFLLHSVTSFFGLTSGSSNSNSHSNITINTGKRSSSSTAPPSSPSPSGIICAAPLLSADAPLLSLSTPPLLFSQQMSKISSASNHSSSDSPSSPSRLPQMKGVSSPGFPSNVRIDGLNPDSKGAGPAFVGQVFSMCDPSGTGLMAVTTRLDVPFISRRSVLPFSLPGLLRLHPFVSASSQCVLRPN
ncbi:hypothetical protein ACLOJK_041398 [Asimina triloba]